MSTPIAGIDVDQVTAWFATNEPRAQAPLTFELITGGHSNLTFRVTDAAGQLWVLRRPPLGHVLATAHDMSREHRIISALGPTNVPVPPVVGLSPDDRVNGAPFYVMEFVEGTIVRDMPSAERFSVDQRRAAGESLVDVLARIHDVDIDAAGLGDLSRREGYIGRQLKRWYGQFDASRTRDIPVMDDVHAKLSASIPVQGEATIVHGDYRLDNCMLGADGTVAAVLDWEICTLGDPLADLGLLCVYWTDPGETNPASIVPATTAEGFPTKAELLATYAARSGRDLSQIDFYVAFGYWKLACILEGVYARYAGGAMGDQGEGFKLFGDTVIALGDLAHDTMERW